MLENVIMMFGLFAKQLFSLISDIDPSAPLVVEVWWLVTSERLCKISNFPL